MLASFAVKYAIAKKSVHTIKKSGRLRLYIGNKLIVIETDKKIITFFLVSVINASPKKKHCCVNVWGR